MDRMFYQTTLSKYISIGSRFTNRGGLTSCEFIDNVYCITRTKSVKKRMHDDQDYVDETIPKKCLIGSNVLFTSKAHLHHLELCTE